jgi:DUF1680 family protein
VLACEYGGLNESFAELSARTGDPRWLTLAERIYDHKVLDPLARREDQLANIHSNTQVPKLVGLARISSWGWRASMSSMANPNQPSRRVTSGSASPAITVT